MLAQGWSASDNPGIKCIKDLSTLKGFGLKANAFSVSFGCLIADPGLFAPAPTRARISQRLRRSCSSDALETFVADAIPLPVFVIEVPPLRFVDGKTFRFHRRSQQVAVPALK